jgi:peptidoglycan/LPS O-acetylase OafA/YrhL
MAEAKNSDSSERLPQLDGIRGLAILGVLLCHYSFALPTSTSHTFLSLVEHALSFGWMGVDLFFVLSGFLIGGILIAHRDRPAEHYFKPFYIRRFFRIVPLYAVAIAVYFSTAFFSKFELLLGSGTSISWIWYATFTQNFEGSFFNDAYVFGHSWSLAVEEQFYLIIPLVIWLIPARFFMRTVAALIACSLTLRTAMVLTMPPAQIDKSVYTLLPCRMDALLIGVSCAWLIAALPKRLQINKTALNALLFAFALIVSIFIALNWNYWTPQMRTIGFTVVALTCAVTILISVTDGKSTRSNSYFPTPWLARSACVFPIYISLDFPKRSICAH